MKTFLNFLFLLKKEVRARRLVDARCARGDMAEAICMRHRDVARLISATAFPEISATTDATMITANTTMMLIKTKPYIRKFLFLSLLARPSVSLVTGNVAGKRRIYCASAAGSSSSFIVRPTTLFGVAITAASSSSSSSRGQHRVASESRCCLFMSSSGSGSSSSSGKPPPPAAAAVDISHIGKTEMQQILDDYEHGGRDGRTEEEEESSSHTYVVIDVRTEPEIYATGKLSPAVHTLPLQVILQANVFQMDPDEFEDLCGFEKPTPDETLVFTCAAGKNNKFCTST